MRKLLLCCVLINGVFAFALDGTDGSLSGVVLDPSGAVVMGVSIRIQHWEIDKSGHPALKEDSLVQSGPDGRYAVNLKPGVYDVFTSFSIFSPTAKKVKVDAGKICDFSPKLKIDPYTSSVEIQATKQK